MRANRDFETKKGQIAELLLSTQEAEGAKGRVIDKVVQGAEC